MKTWYVYTLARPDGSIFYVGKGTNGRIFHHEDEAERSCDCEKCQIIRQIWAGGNAVRKQFVFETLDEKMALEHEIFLIQQYAELLVNVSSVPREGRSKKKPDNFALAAVFHSDVELVEKGGCYSVDGVASLLQRHIKAIHLCIKILNIPKVRFPLDRKMYIQKTDVERIKEFMESKNSRTGKRS